jgi:hypothetical protein
MILSFLAKTSRNLAGTLWFVSLIQISDFLQSKGN